MFDLKKKKNNSEVVSQPVTAQQPATPTPTGVESQVPQQPVAAPTIPAAPNASSQPPQAPAATMAALSVMRPRPRSSGRRERR